MIAPLFCKQEVGIWRVQKRYPQYSILIWRLWPNIRFQPSTVTEKNVKKNILDGRTEVKQYTPPPPSGSGGITNWKDMTIIYNANILNCLILFTLQCVHNQDPSFNSTITHYLYFRKIFTKVIFIYILYMQRLSK